MPPSDFATPVWKRPGQWASPHKPVLPGETVDVAIVGAGFMGLSTALHAARKGLSVRVVEAREIGAGASGLNGGQVIPGLKYDPEWLLGHFGEKRGKALIEFGATTADSVFNLINNEKLDVPHVRNGWVQAAHTETALAAARDRDRQWRDRGADAVMLSSSEIAALTGARGYIGGWLDRRAGVIDPLSFVTELGRIADEAGARIAERTPVKSVRKADGFWRVTTAAGQEIRARHIIVATNAYSDGLVPGLARTLVPLHSFQIATAPLPENFQREILPRQQAVSDSRRILVYYRKSADGRLVLGGRGRMAVPKSAGDWQHLERALTRLYPALAGVPIENRWFGRVAMTPDHLPHIHEPEQGLVTVVGCQGRGVGMMTSMGRILADYIAGGERDALPFPVTPIRPIPLHAFRQVGVAAAIAWYRLLDAIEK